MTHLERLTLQTGTVNDVNEGELSFISGQVTLQEDTP